MTKLSLMNSIINLLPDHIILFLKKKIKLINKTKFKKDQETKQKQKSPSTLLLVGTNKQIIYIFHSNYQMPNLKSLHELSITN